MSFKPEFQVGSDPHFYDNALRFSTREEAERNARAKAWAWTSVADFRVVESDEPVNYRWTDAGLVEVQKEPSP